MDPRVIARASLLVASLVGFLTSAGVVSAGQSDLEQTMPVVWVFTAASIIGAAFTFAFLAYAIWKFRDPRARGRRYG